MTQSEWDACTDPAQMLTFLRDQVSERKVRLFTCACCRRIWHLLVDERSCQAIHTAERCADQLASEEELQSAQQAASRVASELVRAQAQAAAEAVRATMSPWAVVWQTAWAVARSQVKDVSRQIAERESVQRGGSGPSWRTCFVT
jgi:hypothetical protein